MLFPLTFIQALLASKICSYAQGMNVIKAKSAEQKWNINLGGLARIWKVRARRYGRKMQTVEIRYALCVSLTV